MGTSTSWIAVEGASLDELARELPPATEWQAVILPSGWALLIGRLERDGVVAEPELLARLSRDRRVVGCDEESHVMYSASAEWRDGGEVWAVLHASEAGADHLVGFRLDDDDDELDYVTLASASRKPWWKFW